MRIQLYKFGNILLSRESGREALLAFQSTFPPLKKTESLEIDFDDLGTLTPSSADEFLTPLAREIGPRLVLLPSKNLSVTTTIDVLEKSNKMRFNWHK